MRAALVGAPGVVPDVGGRGTRQPHRVVAAAFLPARVEQHVHEAAQAAVVGGQRVRDARLDCKGATEGAGGHSAWRHGCTHPGQRHDADHAGAGRVSTVRSVRWRRPRAAASLHAWRVWPAPPRLPAAPSGFAGTAPGLGPPAGWRSASWSRSVKAVEGGVGARRAVVIHHFPAPATQWVHGEHPGRQAAARQRQGGQSAARRGAQRPPNSTGQRPRTVRSLRSCARRKMVASCKDRQGGFAATAQSPGGDAGRHAAWDQRRGVGSRGCLACQRGGPHVEAGLRGNSPSLDGGSWRWRQ